MAKLLFFILLLAPGCKISDALKPASMQDVNEIDGKFTNEINEVKQNVGLIVENTSLLSEDSNEVNKVIIKKNNERISDWSDKTLSTTPSKGVNFMGIDIESIMMILMSLAGFGGIGFGGLASKKTKKYKSLFTQACQMEKSDSERLLKDNV